MGAVNGNPGPERNQQLRAALPASELLRPIRSLPASPGAHREIVALGFEGTVLKRPASLYRPGRHSVWLRHKARHVTRGVPRAVGQDREGQWYGICDVAGRGVAALTAATAADQLGEPVVLVYLRVDASGGLHEVRIVADAGAADTSVAA